MFWHLWLNLTINWLLKFGVVPEQIILFFKICDKEPLTSRIKNELWTLNVIYFSLTSDLTFLPWYIVMIILWQNPDCHLFLSDLTFLPWYIVMIILWQNPDCHLFLSDLWPNILTLIHSDDHFVTYKNDINNYIIIFIGKIGRIWKTFSGSL
jgi:hypothetical protein